MMEQQHSHEYSVRQILLPEIVQDLQHRFLQQHVAQSVEVLLEPGAALGDEVTRLDHLRQPVRGLPVTTPLRLWGVMPASRTPVTPPCCLPMACISRLLVIAGLPHICTTPPRKAGVNQGCLPAQSIMASSAGRAALALAWCRIATTTKRLPLTVST